MVLEKILQFVLTALVCTDISLTNWFLKFSSKFFNDIDLYVGCNKYVISNFVNLDQ